MLPVAMLLILSASVSFAQTRDTGKLMEYENPFYKTIEKAIAEFEKKEQAPKLKFKMDFTGHDLPKTTAEFTQVWHNDPVAQGNSGMCWCYATTSLMESECYRLHQKKIKLSELHTVYWEYVEKARRFVREQGDSEFGQGSQANAVLRIWKQYGCVPAEAYTGMKEGQVHHNHSKMFAQMQTYLQSVKRDNAWNEKVVLDTIKSILNHHIGEPPKKIQYQGRTMTPRQFLANEVKVKPDDYIDVLSLMTASYWQKAEYTCPDNWWHSKRYNNVPLDDFMTTLKRAVKDGYSLMIGGDVSESGYFSFKDVAMVPSYDIPSAYIDEHARQFRFSNNTTTDDHAIHVVGTQERDNGTWFLIKDSGSGARNGANPGYYFYHEDYLKLKMMYFVVHKSAVKGLLTRMKK
ncbi:MAG: C1 family peptidase [Phycisphaerae bacterium]|nr:C1 family peptidase [Phycisphaerae bacterium]